MSDRAGKILLSPPHLSGREEQFVAEAFASGWIAPVGPFVTRFEEEFAARVGVDHALALSSGTAALHLALIEAGIGPGDEVAVSTFTFVASVNPILQLGATPVFVDSELTSWNMDPDMLAQVFADRAASGRLPKAAVVVHLYGQCADLGRIGKLCEQYGVALIEDAAEALGATYRDRSPGGFGIAGIFSFNGNKIITTSGGGMLVSNNGDLIAHARKLSTQARDEAAHYQHSEIGFNYRLSNILAAIGVGQLEKLDSRVAARRRNFEYYREALGDVPGITFMPEAPWGLHTRWLTCILFDSTEFATTREGFRLALEREGIEARPLWKPMHLQPVFQRYEVSGGGVSEHLFRYGLCLPSGSNLAESDLERVVDVIREAARDQPRVRSETGNLLGAGI